MTRRERSVLTTLFWMSSIAIVAAWAHPWH